MGSRQRLQCLIMTVIIMAAAGAASGKEKNYSLEAEAGLGYDSNAFLAPENSYFDPFLNSLVQPEKRSGFFIPLALEGKHALGPENTRLLTTFSAASRLYPAGDLHNANAHQLKLTTGLEFLLRSKGRFKDTFFIGPVLGYHQEIYFDPDTGEERATTRTAESLADRYIYYRYGGEAELRVRTTPVRFALKATASQYNYDEVPLLDSLDHLYYRVGGEAEYDIFPATELNLSYSYYARDWDSRRARNLQGNLVNGTIRKYTYSEAGATVQQRLRKEWTIFLDYDRLWRSDEFAGYNDYTRNRYRLRSRYRFGGGSLLRAAVTYWDRSYPRAFAFDDPAFPRKDYRTWEGEARWELPLAGAWKFWSEDQFINQDTTDPRYDYKRHLIALGINREL